MAGIFETQPGHFGRIVPERSIKLIAELLWAEARRLALPSTRVHVPSNLNVADRGIDASVDSGPEFPASDLIRQSKTRFQIKTGGFQPNNKSHLQKELFGQTGKGRAKTATLANLKPGIKECLEQGSRYVIVAFGAKMTVMQREAAIKQCQDFFAKCGFNNADVDVWGQDDLQGFFMPFPSLRLKVNGRDGAQVQSHATWSLDATMNNEQKPLKLGPEQKRFIETIRDALLHRSVGHIRVSGEAGVGKTRLVHTATCDPAIAPSVLYFPSPKGLYDSGIIHEFLAEDSPLHAVLIIDECDPDRRADLVSKFKYRSDRVQVISIYQDVDLATGDIVKIPTPPLEDEQVSEIIQTYDVPGIEAYRWAKYCHGQPRAAHIIGHNLKNNPEDLLAPIAEERGWERWIAGPDPLDSPKVHQRTIVLKYIALFRRFGFAEPHIEEAEFIAKLIEADDPSITWARFRQIVAYLREQKYLQGERTLYITPQIAHIWLWVQWWKSYGGMFKLQEFLTAMPPSLIAWFQEMFRFAAESDAATRFVEKLLGPDGPFQDSEFLRSERGSDFFLTLAEAHPTAALDCLKRTLATWSDEELRSFGFHRQNIIYALQHIVVHRELFLDGARILLRLAENENARWANNASGVFAGLFSPAPEPVAPSEASPEERFPILVEAISSPSAKTRELALGASSTALESGRYVATPGIRPDEQGIRPKIKLWHPKTWGEHFDCYRRVWQLLDEKRKLLPLDESNKIVDILLDRGQGLLRKANLGEMVYATFRDISNQSEQDRGKVLRTVSKMLRREARFEQYEIPAGIKEKLQTLNDELTGNDFSSRLRRYVGLDVGEDLYHERQHGENATEHEIEQLALVSVKEPEKFKSELSWLVTTAAKSAQPFGYYLGRIDRNLTLLPMMYEAQEAKNKDSSLVLLGSYLRGIHDHSEELWEKELESIAHSNKRRSWLAELTWRSGISDRAAIRILDLVEKGCLPLSDLRLFSWSLSFEEISESVFARWIDVILSSDEPGAIWLAVDQFDARFRSRSGLKRVPEEPTFRIVSDRRIYKPLEGQGPYSSLADHSWSQLVEDLVENYPARGPYILKLALPCLGVEGTIFSSTFGYAQRILREIVFRSPDESWEVIRKNLESADALPQWRLGHWMEGADDENDHDNVWDHLPRGRVLEWIDADVENRLTKVISSAPQKLRRNGQPTLTHCLLTAHGSDQHVRHSLISHCMGHGWWGNESDHWRSKKIELLEWKKSESHPLVLKWLDDFADILDRQIQYAEIEEEREAV